MESQSGEQRRIVQIEGVRPLASKKKKAKTRAALAAILLLLTAIVLVFFFLGRSKPVAIKNYTTAQVQAGDFVSSTEASGTVVYPQQITIVSPQEGYADQVFVKEGDTVGPRDVLAVLYVPDLEDQRDDYSSQLAQAKINLEDISLEYSYSLRSLQISLERLAEEIAESEEEVATLKTLAELRSSRQSDYEAAQETLKKLMQNQEDLILTLEKETLKRDISLRKQEAQIRQLEISLGRVNRSLEERNITSPMAGEVLSMNEDLTVSGSLITKSKALFTVADRSRVYLDFQVYEQYAQSLALDSEMSVTLGSTSFMAKIVSIGKVASLTSDGISTTVTVRAEPLEKQNLTPGAQAVAEITLGVRQNALILPRGAYLTTGGQRYVYRIEGDRAYKVPVTFGEIKGTQVEVLSGLSAGDLIITSGYQDFLDQEIVELK